MMYGFSADWPAYYYLVFLVFFGLAAYRLTRLFLYDHLFDSFRAWVWKRRPPENGGVGYLLTCPWCLGFWVSSLLVFAYIIVPVPTSVLALILTMNALVGMLAARDNS
jgi:hypothetical protein